MGGQEAENQATAHIQNGLLRMGLLQNGEAFTMETLSGGVSCDAFKVVTPSRVMCVKRALPKLRVAADWHASPERYKAEAAWMRLAGSVVPGCTPAVLATDETAGLVAMQFFPPQEYPIWKSLLAAGQADAGFAAATGTLLARLHGATAGRPEIAAAFANHHDFYALRIEPYLLFTAARHADVASFIKDMAAGVTGASIALMHGDFSPKNILCGASGPVVLDAETACYGDPAFDLAFCLNHLLLKAVWHPEFRPLYAASFSGMLEAYLAGVTWEDPARTEARAAGLLSAFLLARIDGKSPVEYLKAERDKCFVRDTALGFLHARLTCLADLGGQWQAALVRHCL